VRVLLGGTLKAVKCQQIYHATCSSQVLTRSRGIDLLYGSTANAHVLLLRQENHPPPLSWTLVCSNPTKTSSQPSRCHQYPYHPDLVLLLRRERERSRSIPGYRWTPTSGDRTAAAAEGQHVGRQLSHAGGAGQYVLNNSTSPRIHPNTSQVAHSASYTALSTNEQANPWR
jgi:hypothetical protein